MTARRLRLDPDPLRPEDDPPVTDSEHRRVRSGCLVALILGGLGWVALLVAFALGFLVGAHSVTGHSSATYARVGDERLAPWPTSRSEPTATLGVSTIPVPTETPSAPSPRPAPSRTPRPTKRPTGDVRRGLGTYYCCTRGWAGLAVVALPDWHYVPVGNAIRRWVSVCVLHPGRVGPCGVFPAVDFCACGDRPGGPTVVDLSFEARDELGLDPRLGVYRVEVTVLR